MINSKGASILFTKDEEVVKGASWHQLAKARNRQKVGATEHNQYTKAQHATEDGVDPLKALEEKIREEKMRQERGALPTHQAKLPEKETIPEPFDEFEDDFLPSYGSNVHRNND